MVEQVNTDLTSSHQNTSKLQLNQWSPTFFTPGAGFVDDSFSTDCSRCWEGNRSFARSQLAACCAARSLTGHGMVPVCGPELGNPEQNYGTTITQGHLKARDQKSYN